MCLLHDFAEARVGDLNTVQKKYVRADEPAALEDATRGLVFGQNMINLVREYNEGRTTEAKLAHDADQLALILELKDLMDIGYKPPQGWLNNVIKRVKTETGKKITRAIMSTGRDDWWISTAT